MLRRGKSENRGRKQSRDKPITEKARKKSKSISRKIEEWLNLDGDNS